MESVRLWFWFNCTLLFIWFQLFTDITCLYTQTTDFNRAESGTQGVVPESSQHTPFPASLSCPHPDPISDPCTTSFLFGTESTESDFTEREPELSVQAEDFNVKLDLNSFGSSDVFLRSGTEAGEEEVTFSGWRSRSGAVGRVVSRAAEKWTPRPLPEHGTSSCFNTMDDCQFKLDTTFRHSPVLQQHTKVNTQMSMFSLTVRNFYDHPDLSPMTDISLWGRRESGSLNGVSSQYGSTCWIGGERKRSGEAAGHVGTGEEKLHI